MVCFVRCLVDEMVLKSVENLLLAYLERVSKVYFLFQCNVNNT